MPTWNEAVGEITPQYHLLGYRITPALDVSTITHVTSSNIVWSASAPDGTTFAVHARLDGGGWVECRNNRPIPVTPEGADLTGRTLQVRFSFATDPTRLFTPSAVFLQVKVRQSDNPRVILGVEYGNLAGYTRTLDKRSQRTVAIVGGAGTEEARTTLTVNAAGSGRRREVFVDAGDTDSLITLGERGLQELADREKVDSYEVEAIERQFGYGVEWDLGDFVTVAMPGAGERSMQVRRVTETYEAGNIKVTPEFGKPARTLGSLLSGLDSRLARTGTR